MIFLEYRGLFSDFINLGYRFVNIFSLFFYFSLTLLAHTVGHASSPDDALDNATSSSEISLKSAGTLGSSFLSTPRAIARTDDFDADSPTDATPDDEKKTMKGAVSVYNLLASLLAEEESDEDEDAFTVASPLNAVRKDPIIAADDEGVHRKLLGRHFNKYTILTAENGREAIEKARGFALKGTSVKLFLFDFRMGDPDGGETALQVRDMEVTSEKPFQNSIFICVSSTPDDATPYRIKNLRNWFIPGSKDPKEVFHLVRGKIDTPLKAQEVIVFVNELLDKLASFQLGLLDLAAK